MYLILYPNPQHFHKISQRPAISMRVYLDGTECFCALIGCGAPSQQRVETWAVRWGFQNDQGLPARPSSTSTAMPESRNSNTTDNGRLSSRSSDATTLIMTENSGAKTGANGEAAAAGIPFYEKQRQHLKDLIARRRALEKRIVGFPFPFDATPRHGNSSNSKQLANYD